MGSGDKGSEKKSVISTLSKRFHSKSSGRSPHKDAESSRAADTSSVLSHPSTPGTPATPTARGDTSQGSKMRSLPSIGRSLSKSSHHSVLPMLHLSPHSSTHSPSHTNGSTPGSTHEPAEARREVLGISAPEEANGNVKPKGGLDDVDSESDDEDEDDEADADSKMKRRASASSKASVMSSADSIDGTKISRSRINSVMLAEAADDTPTFRASVEFIDRQFRSLEQWLSDFAHRSEAVLRQLEHVKDSANQLIKMFMPGVTHTSILAQDYTTLLFGRYTEGVSIFWSELVAQVYRSNYEIKEMVKRLNEGCFKQYKAARQSFLVALTEQSEAMTMLMRMPFHSEPAALREATFKAYKARKNFLKAATELVIKISELESETSVSLLETLSNQSLPSQSDFFGYSQARLEMSIEFHRLQSIAISLRSALPGISTVLRKMRRNLLKSVKTEKPPKDLKNYHEVELVDIGDHAPEKTGWVNVEVKPGTWVVMWAYLRKGLFGFLGVGADRTVVVESARFPVNSCEFELVSDENRRCLFRVKTSSASVLVQSTTPYHLAEWKAAFAAAKASSGTDHMSLLRLSELSGSIDKELLIPPWTQSFAVPEWSLGVSSGSEAVLRRLKEVRNDINSPAWLEYNSTLTSKENTFIVSTVPAVKPMPTSVPLEAVVANTYFKPAGIPNAIIGNIWGSLGSKSGNSDPVHYEHSFTRYPDNYPKTLAVQDMDMRAITAQLPRDEIPEDDDFLVFFLRATSNVRGNEAPARIYVTAKKLITYTCWHGLVSLQSYDMKSVLEAETTHGVDWSDLRISVHVPNVKNEVRVIPFRLYIDSGTLAKRKLAFVLENVRSRVPKPSRELLEPLVIIGIEYAEAVKADETRMESDLAAKLGGDATKLDNKGGNNITTLLLRRSIGSADTRGEDAALETGKGMQSKLAEDTFPVNSETLFNVMFGSKSPVFSGPHTAVIDTINEVGPWYRKGKRLERRINQKYTLAGQSNEAVRYNHQRVDRQERNWYVVLERRSPLEMPSGERFYSVLRYVIYNTEQGCHLQIWTRIVWMNSRGVHTDDEVVIPILKAAAQETIMRVRQSAEKAHSLDEAIKRFGKVRATKVLSSKDEDSEDEEQVIRVSGKSMALIITRSPLFSIRRLRWFIVNLFYALFRLSSPRVFLIAMLAISLITNYKLYTHSSVGYWEAYLEHKSTEDFLTNLQLLPDQSPTIFHRAVYTKDIDDLIANGSLWEPPVNKPLENETSTEIGDVSHEVRYGCSARFNDVARLGMWASNFGNLYEFEAKAKEAMERISDIRLDYAILRNEMMTMLRVLNAKEREDLDSEYRAWLINETSMCSQVRSVVHMLNATVLDEVRLYCLSCLEEARGLF